MHKGETSKKRTDNDPPLYYHDAYGDEHSHPNQMQLQAHLKAQRCAQASAQMVYEVYGNVIAILEEFEQRELRHKSVQHNLPRSAITMPSQDHKRDVDVERILDTQLLLFESQLRYCRQEIKAKVVSDLRDVTLQWLGRRDQITTKDLTDTYTVKLFEILAIGTTEHNHELNQAPGDVKGLRPEDMRHVITSQHKIGENDRAFVNDPSRKAKAPLVRQGNREKGAERIRSLRRDLERHLPHYAESDDDMK